MAVNNHSLGVVNILLILPFRGILMGLHLMDYTEIYQHYLTAMKIQPEMGEHQHIDLGQD